MVGQRLHEREVVLAERRDARRVGAHRAEHAIAGDHRGDDEGPDREVVHDAIGALEVDEGGIRRVVLGDQDPPLGDGSTEEADSRRQLQAPDGAPPAGIGDPGVVGELQLSGRGVEEVGHRAVGMEEPSRLLEGVVEDRVVLRGDQLGGGERAGCGDLRRGDRLLRPRGPLRRRAIPGGRRPRCTIDLAVGPGPVAR